MRFLELYRERRTVVVDVDKIVTVEEGGMHFPTMLLMDNGQRLEFTTSFRDTLELIKRVDRPAGEVVGYVIRSPGKDVTTDDPFVYAFGTDKDELERKYFEGFNRAMKVIADNR